GCPATIEEDHTMTVTDTKSRHVVSLATRTPRFQAKEGLVNQVDVTDLPILHRLSIRRLVLERNGLREPHWHANAHELGYCLRGRALITIAANHAERESFVVTAGEMFFIPSGAMHAIANVGAETAEFILAFSHERPEDFGMRTAFGAMSNAVLGNTY